MVALDVREVLRRAVPLICLLGASCHPPQAPQSKVQTEAAGNFIPASLDDGASASLPDGILDRHALIRFIRAAYQFKPADQFSPTFDDSAIRGRRFHVELITSPNVRYDASRHTLTMSQGTEFQDGYNFVPLYSLHEEEPPKPESNAFGVTVAVTPETEVAFGIGSAGCKLGLFRGTYGVCLDLAKTLRMPGDQARAATAGLAAELDGTVVADKDGKSVHCSSAYEEPTIGSPREVHTHTCVLSVQLSKMVLRSPSFGVVAAWGAK